MTKDDCVYEPMDDANDGLLCLVSHFYTQRDFQ